MLNVLVQHVRVLVHVFVLIFTPLFKNAIFLVSVRFETVPEHRNDPELKFG
jgi:hypothetical protein